MAELTTLARPYAKAAFESARDSDSLNTWSQGLALVAAVVGDTGVKAALSSPSLTHEQQGQLVIDLCGDEIHAGLGNFIRILAENKRLALLPEVLALFEEHKALQEKKVDVTVKSAFPLHDSLQHKLVEALKTRLARDVVIHTEVDKKLIGGLVIRAGDLVIDGSVRGRLAKLAEAMNS